MNPPGVAELLVKTELMRSGPKWILTGRGLDSLDALGVDSFINEATNLKDLLS